MKKAIAKSNKIENLEKVEKVNKNNLKTINMSDVRKSLALHYQDPTVYQFDLGDNREDLVINEYKYFVFTLNKDKKFTLSLRDGVAPENATLITYIVYENQIIPLYKDNSVKGTLVYLNRTTKRENENKSQLERISGICLIQGKKYFGYNLTISSIDIEDGKSSNRKTQKHIYGFGDVNV